jgi:hypothetical protein
MKLKVFLLGFLMLLSTFLIVESTEADVDNDTRADEDFLTLRSNSHFYTGDVRREIYGDVNGDGVDDAIIAGRTYPPGQYHLRVIDLATGQLLYSYDTTYGDISLKLINVDDDPELELIVNDYDWYIAHSKYFIYDFGTSSIVFQPPLLDGSYYGEIIGDEFVLNVREQFASYIDDRTEWWETYNMSTWTKTWETPKFVRGSGIYEDIDNDGIMEYIYWSNWIEYTPDRGNVYFIDIADHEVKLNTTDVGGIGYGGYPKTQVDSFDLDADGYSEVLIHAYWSHNSTSRTYLYSAKTNQRVWSTVNLSNYRLRENPILRDINEDGTMEIILILSDKGTEYLSKVVVLDPLTGEVLLDTIMNDRFYTSYISVIDLNGDGNKDFFVYNATNWQDGMMTFKAFDPTNSWSQLYDVSIPNMKS